MPLMMRKDSVAWDRETVTGTDDLGHEATGHAAGFPQTVLCNFQRRAVSANAGRAGTSERADASAFSETFVTGRVGDLVTKNGDTFRVVAVAPRERITTSAIEYVRYDLKAVLPIGGTP